MTAATLGLNNGYTFTLGLFLLVLIVSQLMINVLAISQMLLKYLTPFDETKSIGEGSYRGMF
jgi:hypothetical protein